MGVEQVIERFFAALERCDRRALEEIYSDDVRVWHNFTGIEQDKQTNIARLEMAWKLAKLKYDVIERIALGDRVIQRHMLRFQREGQPDSLLHAALFITVRDGRIARIDEYLDPSQSVLVHSAKE
jgi:ketosteroid isomerase-like protein